MLHSKQAGQRDLHNLFRTPQEFFVASPHLLLQHKEFQFLDLLLVHLKQKSITVVVSMHIPLLCTCHLPWVASFRYPL